MESPFPILIGPSSQIPPQPSAAALSPTTANPISHLPQSFNHPPYAQMIFEAIGALKETNGSSKQAIAKYIEGAYKDQLPPNHSALLTHHLKLLRNNGHLIMIKKSYKLAGSLSDVPNPAADLNSQLPPFIAAASLVDGQNGQPSAVKKGPGRPRKQPIVVADGAPKRGRGRPPKNSPLGAKKSPGRPRKPKPKTVAGSSGLKRGRGRPPKALVQVQLLQSDVQPQVAGGPMPVQLPVVPYANEAATVPNVPRPRGRPKAAAAASGVGVGVSGKRRGRPPKIGVVSEVMKRKTSTGKVGRPRKITEGSAELALATVSSGDMKRKLEHFQSKIKEAVAVLKPQFSSESNISVDVAIRELEELASMDINAPLREEPEAPLPQD